MLKIEITTVGGDFFEQLDDLLFLYNFPDPIILHFEGGKIKILQKDRQSINGKMDLLILKPIKRHMFTGLKNMGAIVLEYLLKVVDSFK